MADTNNDPSPSFIVSVAAGCIVACLALALFHAVSWITWSILGRVKFPAMPMPHTDFSSWLLYGVSGAAAMAVFFLVTIVALGILSFVGDWAIGVVRAFGRREATTETHLDGAGSKAGEGRAASLDS